MTTHPDIPPAPVPPPPLPSSGIPGGRPVVIVTTTTCLYPLHPADNYAGPGDLRQARGLPPETPIVLRPQWPPDTPGTWHWCRRCTRRNAGRTAMVAKMYARMQAATTARVTAVRHLPIPLTGRFITPLSMGAFARRHCLPGMRWCPRSAHYVAASAMCTTNVSYRHWCQVCVNLLWPKRRAEQRLRLRREQQAMQAKYNALAHNRELLRKEIRELRALKALLDREMLKRPEPPSTADLLQALAQPEEASTRPLPAHRPRDRRKSFST